MASRIIKHSFRSVHSYARVAPQFSVTRGPVTVKPQWCLATSRFYNTPASQPARQPDQPSHAQPGETVQSVTTENKQPTSKIAQFIKNSKELLAFYKNGLKLLWANSKEAKQLTQKVKEEGYVLSRAEFQLVHRSAIDMRKMVPFGVLVLVLPESIPFFVVFAPGIIPSTCVTAKQTIAQREKRDKIRQTMSANVINMSKKIPGISAEDFLTLKSFKKIAKHYDYDFALSRINKPNLSAYCRFMGLPGWGTKSMLENRLEKHFAYLEQDDKLLAAEGVEKLTLEEAQHAAEERGIRSLNAPKEQLYRSLNYWLNVHLAEPSIAKGLIVFSRMFLLNANYK